MDPRSEVTNDDAQQLEHKTTAYNEQQGDCNKTWSASVSPFPLKQCMRLTKPKLADGTLLGDGLLDGGFGLSALDFLLLCEGLVCAALLRCLNLFGSVSSCALESVIVQGSSYHCDCCVRVVS